MVSNSISRPFFSFDPNFLIFIEGHPRKRMKESIFTQDWKKITSIKTRASKQRLSLKLFFTLGLSSVWFWGCSASFCLTFSLLAQKISSLDEIKKFDDYQSLVKSCKQVLYGREIRFQNDGFLMNRNVNLSSPPSIASKWAFIYRKSFIFDSARFIEQFIFIARYGETLFLLDGVSLHFFSQGFRFPFDALPTNIGNLSVGFSIVSNDVAIKSFKGDQSPWHSQQNVLISAQLISSEAKRNWQGHSLQTSREKRAEKWSETFLENNT